MCVKKAPDSPTLILHIYQLNCYFMGGDLNRIEGISVVDLYHMRISVVAVCLPKQRHAYLGLWGFLQWGF